MYHAAVQVKCEKYRQDHDKMASYLHRRLYIKYYEDAYDKLYRYNPGD